MDKFNLNLKLFTSSMGNTGIIYNNFSYRRDNSIANGDIGWRCLEKKCTTTMYYLW